MYLLDLFKKEIKLNSQVWNPFLNWNPITKISYIELDIIVSKLVYYTKAIEDLETIAESTVMQTIVDFGTIADQFYET